jgi:acyl-coenzyme A synthetase/AMP-(fatty) acid ligase
MHVVDMVFHWARIDPHRPAIVLPELVTTFSGLADAIDSISNRIDELGLDPHEPVATAIANPALAIAVVFALQRSGYSTAPANRGLIKHLQSNGVRNLIYDTEGFVASGGRNIRFDNSWLPAAPSNGRSSDGRTWRRRPVGDVDIVFFTSGTTGLPKKFVLTRAGFDQRIAWQRTTADATRKSALIVPGLASAFGVYQLCELLHAGKTACFAASPDAMLQLIGLHRIDTLIASPQQALGLAALKEARPDFDVASLQTVLIGGASIGREGIKRIRAALCRNVINRYSSTEGGQVAMAPFDLVETVPGASGFVSPWADVEIVDEAGATLPAGREGMIRYRTPQIVGNSKRANGGAATDQWFYPGDMGRLTAEGILCLTGRISDVINLGGVKVSARQIEEILEAMEEVREAAACGVEDASGVEQLWAAVVASGPLDAAALKVKAQAHPDIGSNLSELFVLPELPCGDAGKVQKPRLKELMLGLSRGA